MSSEVVSNIREENIWDRLVQNKVMWYTAEGDICKSNLVTLCK